MAPARRLMPKINSMERLPWRYSETRSSDESSPREISAMPSWQMPGTLFSTRSRSSMARRIMCLRSVTSFMLGPLMFRMPLRRLTKSGPFTALNAAMASASSPGKKLWNELAVPPANTNTAPCTGYWQPSMVYSPSCMGARKYRSQPRLMPPSSLSNSSKNTSGIFSGGHCSA